MNDPQVWTLIGVFTTIMLGAMTLMTVQINRTIAASINGLRGEMIGRFDGVHGRIDGVHHRIDGVHHRIDGLHSEMNARFDTMDTKFEHLDRDVTALSRHIWRDTTGD